VNLDEVSRNIMNQKVREGAIIPEKAYDTGRLIV
jgi:hypothetical protein